jgi:hypothetical protein
MSAAHLRVQRFRRSPHQRQRVGEDLRADLPLLENVQKITSAVDNVGARSTDGLPAAVRHLVGLSQDVIDVYNRRDETILSA